MSAVIGTGNFPKALSPGVLAFWSLPDQYPAQWEGLVNDIEKSERAYEEVVQTIAFAPAVVKPQGRQIATDSMVQGYTTRITAVTYGLQYAITMEARDDNQYEKLARQYTQSLKDSHSQATNIVVANVFNFGFNSALQTIGDGQAFFSLTHPSEGGAFANMSATPSALSEASVEDMVVAVSNFRDPRGNRAVYSPLKLQVGTANQFVAERVLKSMLQNDTGNNAINALKAKRAIPEGYDVNHFFTNANAYFLKNKVAQNTGVLFIDRQRPTLRSSNDENTLNMLVSAVQRFGVGVSDPRCYYGNAG